MSEAGVAQGIDLERQEQLVAGDTFANFLEAKRLLVADVSSPVLEVEDLVADLTSQNPGAFAFEFNRGQTNIRLVLMAGWSHEEEESRIPGILIEVREKDDNGNPRLGRTSKVSSRVISAVLEAAIMRRRQGERNWIYDFAGARETFEQNVGNSRDPEKTEPRIASIPPPRHEGGGRGGGRDISLPPDVAGYENGVFVVRQNPEPGLRLNPVRATQGLVDSIKAGPQIPDVVQKP